MQENIKQEKSCTIIAEEFATDNRLIQNYQDGVGEPKVRLIFIESGKMVDRLVSTNFQKVAESIDQETGLTTWYGSDGKRIEFNDKGIAEFNKEGCLSKLFNISKPIVEQKSDSDIIDVHYHRLFGRPLKRPRCKVIEIRLGGRTEKYEV